MEEGWAADTQCSGGLCGIGSVQATCISEKPTVRSCSWAQMQTRRTGQESNHWKKELESVVDNQLHGASPIKARGSTSSVVKAKDCGGTEKSATSLPSKVSPFSSSTPGMPCFPLSCAEGKAPQITCEGWRRSNCHLLSPGRLCLCPYLVHMHLFLECLDSCTPRVMLKE